MMMVLTAALSACGVGEDKTIPPPLQSVQDFLEDSSNASTLSHMMVTQSSVYNSLGDTSWEMLTLIDNEALSSYIAEQELSKDAFLSHPKLDDFVKAHLLVEETRFSVDAVAEGSVDAKSVEMAYGNTVRFTGAESFQNGYNLLANDVRFGDTCADFVEQPIMVCFAKAPLVADFDWN